jgi:hypothetical protein
MEKKSSPQRKVLLEIKAALKDTEFEDVNWPDDKSEDIENFIWIGFQNQLIGRKICHYEFIFQPKQLDILSLEVHFEVKKYKDLFKDMILTNALTFADWNYENGRIIFKEQYLNINDPNIVTKSLELLNRLHKLIGFQLIEILQVRPTLNSNKYQKPVLCTKPRKVVKSRFYGERTCEELGCIDSIHGKLQTKLIKQLNNTGEYVSVFPENGFENYYYQIDVLAKTKKNQYDIFEVKPYQSATSCIREALGQLLHYKYLLDEGGYKVRTIYIVGPSELVDEETRFLDSIQQSLKESLKYLPIKI